MLDNVLKHKLPGQALRVAVPVALLIKLAHHLHSPSMYSYSQGNEVSIDLKFLDVEGFKPCQ